MRNVPDASIVKGLPLRLKGEDSLKRKFAHQGINSTWRDPATGHIFELQFHTPASFEAKTVTHRIYEQARLRTSSPAQRDALNQQQNEIFSQLGISPGATGIPPS